MNRSSAKGATWAQTGKGYVRPTSDAKWQDARRFVGTVMRYELGIACVDLDSVLLYHDSEESISRLGRALPLGRKLVDLLKLWGYRVVVLTARPTTQHKRIAAHLKREGFAVDQVTNVKPPADCYIDDKAFRVPKNWQ